MPWPEALSLMELSMQSLLRASVIAPIQTLLAKGRPNCAVNTEPRGVVNRGRARPTSAGVIGPYLNLRNPLGPISVGTSPPQPTPPGQSIVSAEPTPQFTLA